MSPASNSASMAVSLPVDMVMNSSLNIIDMVRIWIAGEPQAAAGDEYFVKHSPSDGRALYRVSRSGGADVAAAVAAERRAQPEWGALPPVRRGAILQELAIALRTEREPLGVAWLIIAANTPIAFVAWKVFPSVICGNAAVLKAAEDTPLTAYLFAELARTAGLPAGVLNVIQGYGAEAGAPLVLHPDVAVLSFTGSTAVGRRIAELAGKRLAKVSLELGGKNPLVVCDDADLDLAVKWTTLSAFSNAGQRCAAASRVIVFDAVYAAFREKLLAAVAELRVGTADDDAFGPVINERQLNNMIVAVDGAVRRGAVVSTGGGRLTGPQHHAGYYMAPTVNERVRDNDDISTHELFGPITCLYRAQDFHDSLTQANASPYGLTACIHTRNLHRALEFVHRVQAGVAGVNGGTYGSEPHMPFGGVKQSGNGSREPGTEALDVYSQIKAVYLNVDPAQL